MLNDRMRVDVGQCLPLTFPSLDDAKDFVGRYCQGDESDYLSESTKSGRFRVQRIIDGGEVSVRASNEGVGRHDDPLQALCDAFEKAGVSRHSIRRHSSPTTLKCYPPEGLDYVGKFSITKSIRPLPYGFSVMDAVRDAGYSVYQVSDARAGEEGDVLKVLWIGKSNPKSIAFAKEALRKATHDAVKTLGFEDAMAVMAKAAAEGAVRIWMRGERDSLEAPPPKVGGFPSTGRPHRPRRC